MRLCPFAQRAILALNAKNIDYEVVNINLAEKPEWLTMKSAFGKRAIDINVCDSLKVCYKQMLQSPFVSLNKAAMYKKP